MAKKSSEIKNVWMVTREYDGLAGAGGVKDVCKQLSHALARAGINITVVMPLYGMMNKERLNLKPTSYSFNVRMDYTGEERQEEVCIWKLTQGKVRILFVDSARFSEKKGVYTYTAEEEAQDPSHKQGGGHYDYFAMNVLLQKAALELMIYMDERPEIIHCQDGHTAIIPAIIREADGYRAYFAGTGTLVTVHNAGVGYHQEVGDLSFAGAITGLPGYVIEHSLLHNAFDPFIAAARYAVINTVSENYARELQETEADRLTGWLGHSLKSRGIVLEGVTNGIDPEDFDPEKPEKLGIPVAFSPLKDDFQGKEICKKTLIEDVSKRKFEKVNAIGRIDYAAGKPLLTMVGRLTEQKGVDILVQALQMLMPKDKEFQVLILGSGSRHIENSLATLAGLLENKGRMAVLFGYDPVLANQIYAAGDFFVIPSQYEPCGLTDFMAQLMGNVPIVHLTGGLVKVIDGQTGFGYTDHNPEALVQTIEKALAIYRDTPAVLRQIQRKAVEAIDSRYTWDRVLGRYISLYQKAQNMIKLIG
ncbi:MAG: glycogen/starch synthase [Deltaproteobacteria bacterium]|nr:glycogen/starch synthase [Deltaproteobacteria bacterium]